MMSPFVLLLQILATESSSWIASDNDSNPLPIATYSIVAGEHNDTIYLLGGQESLNTVALYDINTDTIISSNTSALSKNINGPATSVQIDNKLYIFYDPGEDFITYNMNNGNVSFDDNIVGIDGESLGVPYHLKDSSCITLYDNVMIVIGGMTYEQGVVPYRFTAGSPEVSIFNFSSYNWTNGTVLSSAVSEAACVVEEESAYLYIVYEEYIERIEIDDVLSNTGLFDIWFICQSVSGSAFSGVNIARFQFFKSSDHDTTCKGSWTQLGQQLNEPLYKMSTVAYDGYVYIIGGTPSPNHVAGDGIVYRIDETGDLMNMTEMQLPYGLYDTTAIIVDDVLYLFGGMTDLNGTAALNATDSWLKWNFGTRSPTTTPTTSAPTAPTGDPTGSPTANPSTDPSEHPTESPTASPSTRTLNPSGEPTTEPTESATIEPSHPTLSPTAVPSNEPTSFTLSASALSETPQEVLISVALGLGLWIFCILTCLLLHCQGIGQKIRNRMAETKDVRYLAESSSNMKEPGFSQTPSNSIRNEQNYPNQQMTAHSNQQMTASKIINVKLESPPVLDEEGMDTEGRVAMTGSAMSPSSPSATEKMERWIAEKERNERESVRKWLEIIGFEQYFDFFVNNGLGRMADVERIQSHDELESVGIMDIEDRTKLIAAIRRLK